MARTETRVETTEQQTKEFVQDAAGVLFRDGTMVVRGQVQAPVNVAHWQSSNELTTYTTVEWVDPSTGDRRTSCNCRGWAFKKRGQDRSCCHTKDMQGTAACTKRKKVDAVKIHSVQEAVSAIPDMEHGKELRGLDLSDWD